MRNEVEVSRGIDTLPGEEIWSYCFCFSFEKESTVKGKNFNPFHMGAKSILTDAQFPLSCSRQQADSTKLVVLGKLNGNWLEIKCENLTLLCLFTNANEK